MAKISVIVPIYNKEKYLYKCIESILAQRSCDLELLLVNDGSTDQSDAICRRFLSDMRVKYIVQQNAGPAAARQHGIDLACGDYLGFVDADDWIEPNMYSVMLENALHYDADIVMCNTIENVSGRKAPPAIRSGFYNH